MRYKISDLTVSTWLASIWVLLIIPFGSSIFWPIINFPLARILFRVIKTNAIGKSRRHYQLDLKVQELPGGLQLPFC